MTDRDHVCVIYIQAPPEAVWQGLTSAEFTRRYFHQTEIESDWQPGSEVIYYNADRSIAVKGEVLEVEYPRLLSFTWHVQYNPEAQAEGATRVRFTLEAVEGATKLTLIHDQFVANSVLIDSISDGWIAILSNLKTLLETGEAMAVS
ncbi:MAG: SRPBCC family protein [Gammaproteobacteria bacterium]|nr:SRPBCC family protein [Gammaproteobacteria bacterium]